MSHIDSFKHEIVGRFGYLPVYHPLEDIDGDFIATPKSLIFGGGSGEHPALVFENALSAVAWYLDENVSGLTDNDDQAEVWRKIFNPYVTYYDQIKFYDWTINRYNEFRKLCVSRALRNRCNGDDIEQWLIMGVGEFVFAVMPDLASEIMDQLVDPYQNFYPKYSNIDLIPPNALIYANHGNAFTFGRTNPMK